MKDVSQKTSLCRGIVFTISWLGMALLFNSCVVMNGRYYDVRKPGEAINPTSYEFDFSRSEVLSALDSCFTDKKYLRTAKGLRVSFWKGKIELGTFHQSCIKSYVYRQKRTHEWLSFSYCFLLEVDSLAPHLTRVSVTYKRSSLHAGDYLAFNPHSMNLKISRFLDLASTTIEEYEVLLIMGKELGQRGMPPVRYPGVVTLQQVLDNFLVFKSQTLPFTKGEMKFGDD